jgi:hypothetical protein
MLKCAIGKIIIKRVTMFTVMPIGELSAPGPRVSQKKKPGPSGLTPILIPRKPLGSSLATLHPISGMQSYTCETGCKFSLRYYVSD